MRNNKINVFSNSFKKHVLIFILFIVRMFDFSSYFFNHKEDRLHIYQNIHLYKGDLIVFKILCAISDLAVCYKIGDINYIVYTLFFPSDIHSIINFILFVCPNEVYLTKYLINFKPNYLSLLKGNISVSSAMLNLGSAGFYQITEYANIKPLNNILRSTIFQNLTIPYRLGYQNNHIPCLNILWYLHLSIFEQYSKVVYSLSLILSIFLLYSAPFLLPLFVNGSSFIAYLPFILKSKYLNIYFVLALLFERLFMQFRDSDIVNTNFLVWVSTIFCTLYILERKYEVEQRLIQKNVSS